MANEEHEGASKEEQLIEACRRNNVDLLAEIIDSCSSESEITRLLNDTTTVLGNHLYHEAALQGNYEVIDMLLDQPDFECDPINRREGDTPLHSAIRWINLEPPEQRPFGNALVEMMLEAGSNSRLKNKGGLTPYQLVDPLNIGLRQVIQKNEYSALNQGDFIQAEIGDGRIAFTEEPVTSGNDEDADFSGSDEEDRAEWENMKQGKKLRNE